MKFAEFFDAARAPVISFEVFPPKTAAAMDNLRAVLPQLVALRPTYMTVTYGAMGSTRAKTLEIAASIRRDFGVECACHLTCVGSTRAEIDAQLDEIARQGIENIVALRGDPPQGEGRFVPVAGGFAHASELVAHIREQARSGWRRFGIAVAGYPEKHVEAPDFDTDLRHLARKVAAGADLVITQLFYDNADYFRFVERARVAGVAVPIVPGLLPIQSLPQIERIAGMCGAKIPAELRARLSACGDDAERVRETGAEWCLSQSHGLLRGGAPGIHYYVLNRASQMEAILGALRREAAL
jgi:methylenetetrahydrofolate reductase (NADPH)